MAVTFQKAKELLRQISKKVTGSTYEWTSFLSAAAKMYKYSFNDQLLIYAQNPKATACATMETWNKKLLHWIKAGSKGIALIKNNNGKAHLEYVFDISNTYALNKAKQPRIWSVSKNNYKYVLKKLEKEYGSLKGNNFTEKLMFLAESIVKQNYKDYVHNLLQATKNTYLEELDTQNIEVIFRDTLIASVQYTLLSRCGINADKYFENEDFKGITNFNTPAAFSYIGNVINNISKPILQQIEHNVKVHDNRNIEKNSDIKYINNKDIEKIGVIENVGQVEKENHTTNRGVGIDISSRGGLSNTRHRNRGGTAGNRNVGNEKNGILERKSKDTLFNNANDVGIKSTSSGDRQAGNGKNERINKSTNGTIQSQRRIESKRPNEMGTRNEQYKTNSRRNNTKRNNIQLNVFPTVDEQLKIIKAEVSKASAFFITKNDINNALKVMNKDKISKFKTFEYFQKAISIEKSIEFLKNECKIGSQPFTFSNLVNGNIEISQNGFTLKTNDNTSGIYYSWSEVAKQIYSLVKNNKYLSSSEQEEYKYWKDKNDKEIQQSNNKKISNEKNVNEFKITQEDIDKALIYMNRVKENKMRTYMRFQNKHTLKDDIEFLKNVYNQFKILFVFHDNSLGHMIFDNKNFILTTGENKSQINIPLKDAVKRIRELISEDKFLSEDEKIQYQEWNKRRIEELKKEEENAEIIIKPLFSNEPETIIKLNDNKIKEIEEIEQQEAESKEEKGQIQNSENDNLQSETRLDEHEKTTLQENSKNVLEENQKSINKQNFDLVNVEEYAKLKVEYPNYVIGVQKDDSLILYGKDAENAAEYLNLNIETKDIKDLGKTPVICFPFSKWRNYGDILQDKGFNFVFANENEEKDSYKILSIQNTKPKDIANENQIKDTSESKEINFIITNDDLGIGGQKTKYSFNVSAIKTLKLIESENRLATKEEQEILSKYVGWGGISQVFDSNNEKWSKEYKELKELVTDSEYEAIRKTTLSAYYTPPIVIKSIYKALEQTGFKTGKILEPSCGIGNFFGLLPKKIEQSQLYGVELDDITGRIAKQLYQKANIAISGYEKTKFPDNYFDVAIGNIPFGNYKVADSRYNKNNFSIHDYFFAKTIDQIKPNGIIAFVTTKGVLDKQNSKAREYIAQRADLLGAVRLPNNAFKQNAGTDVTTDIIFLKKRSKLLEKEQLPEWVHVGKNNENVPVNQYFLNNPQMLLGKMEFYKNMYGDENGTACIPFENAELSTQLETAINALNLPKIEPIEIDDIPELEELKEKMNGALPILDDNCKIRNLSYIFLWDKLYFRENNFFIPKKVSQKKLERLRELVKLRDITRELIEKQTDNVSDEEIKTLQGKLNKQYDDFTTKYGFINNAENRKIFDIDSSYPLLCSLEVLNDDKTKLERKADIFFKRTIQPHEAVTHVNTANEALIVSIREKACIDLRFMAGLMGGIENIEKIKQDLQGIIFKNPLKGNDPLIGWETADEYLSGNVREKLKIACEASEKDPSYNINVIKLKQVQPKDLKVSDIEVRLGTEWIDLKYYQQFMYETFKTPNYDKNAIKLDFSEHSNKWYISKKKLHKNTLTTQKYGTERYTAYEILEKTLNFKDIVVKRKEKDFEIIDADATEIVQQKQQDIQEAFKNWIWQDPTRRNELCKKYNELYNNIRPREYNGSHLHFQGINKEYSLKPHQLNGVARILYGGNTLLAHVVGAGKTFTMIAAAMELKRLGLSSKPLIVVPNHIVGQWQSDFLTLYPNANILVASKKDFETKNRKKLFSRIALGNYDAVIIGHTQLEKIPVSPERKKEVIQRQIDELENAIYESELAGNSEYSIKEMEYKKENLSANLEKLMDTKSKDDVIYFEQLGIDRIFIDEAHEFKNLFLYTKMQNVSGINTTSAMKSSDLYAKCRYIDEITDGKGIVFATGTPISNSITELYTMMKYLQHRLLEKTNLRNFDSWAAIFAGKKTAMEIKPEGKGFRLKTRFSHFFNLPELMKLWKECTDVQTADMLNLPRPTPEYINVVTKPTEIQKKMVQMLGKRADKIRAKKVGKAEDNMLNITNDGRKLALDQRVINPLLADEPDSKVSNCVENVYENWKNSTDILGTQLIFCDMSTPKSKNKEENNIKKETKSTNTENENTETNPLLEQEGDERFCIYDDIKEKLIAKGVPENEIAFIHDYDKESEKKELFEKVRSGKIRVLLGSTPKLGAGTNVQDRLVALHHLDCPWRPSDLEQREGRILRRGNMNKNVKIYRYITEGTFDAYNWSVIENKQHFISQVMTSKTPLRSIEDVDATELSYAEVKALAAGDSRIKDIMTLETDIKKLKILKSNFYNEKYEMENKLIMYYPEELEKNKKRIENLISDLELSKNNITDKFVMEIENKTYTKKQEAGEKLIELTQANKKFDIEKPIGEYKGFKISLLTESGIPPKFSLVLNNQEKHYAELGTNPIGNIIRIDNVIEAIPKVLNDVKNRISEIQKDMEISKEEVNKEFPKEKELEEKETHLDTLKKELDSIKTTENQEIDLKVVETKGNQKPSILGKLNEFKQEINKDNKQQNIENKEQKNEVCI